MGHYNRSLSVDATIMVSKIISINTEHFRDTISRVGLAKTPLVVAYNSNVAR